MLTPGGRECPHYYVNAHRRVATPPSCALLSDTPDGAVWTPALCETCPVPRIVQANRCRTMMLHARIEVPGWRFWKGPQVRVSAYCTRSDGPVADPMVGCGRCHGPINFVVYDDNNDKR